MEVCLRLSMTSPLKAKYIIINLDEKNLNMKNSTVFNKKMKNSHNLSVCSFCDTILIYNRYQGTLV